MISQLRGTLLALEPPSLIIDVQGLGYELEAPMSTIYNLPPVGEELTLLTHLVVREDAHLLYGFKTEAERQAFRLLIKISGVGPRIGLAVLSGLTVDQLAEAISLQDPARLTRVPGIGKKTAERLVLELKGKLAQALPTTNPAGLRQTGVAEVLRALSALGYSEKEAHAASQSLPEGITVSDGIRLALKQLSRL
ncbi:MAG: Holliday junction branch migration protein RuvA [Proteobacteria bacterium]|nr:Holliday junction branch migration protein RuvA [Pseudomonadota bacterium]MDA0847565.1 Holliday junction branch migration protein RuvA [Pseudomonadota bacterium]